MSFMSQFNGAYREARIDEFEQDYNLMPDGQYVVIIDNVKYHEKDNKAYVIFQFHVADGDCQGDKCESMIVFSESNKYAASNLKRVAMACGLDILPEQIESAAVRVAFIGYCMKVKKETSGKYTNWQYWQLVSAPARSDGSEFDEPDLDAEKKQDVAQDVKAEVGPLDDDMDIGDDDDDILKNDEPF